MFAVIVCFYLYKLLKEVVVGKIYKGGPFSYILYFSKVTQSD